MTAMPVLENVTCEDLSSDEDDLSSIEDYLDMNTNEDNTNEDDVRQQPLRPAVYSQTRYPPLAIARSKVVRELLVAAGAQQSGHVEHHVQIDAPAAQMAAIMQMMQAAGGAAAGGMGPRAILGALMEWPEADLERLFYLDQRFRLDRWCQMQALTAWADFLAQ